MSDGAESAEAGGAGAGGANPCARGARALPILPPGPIGVLGGGQLGRMFALAANSMGYRVHVFAPEAHGPAAQVADRHVRADFDDHAALEDFARAVRVVTYEFENVPAASVAAVERHVPVRPSGEFLHITQDRLREKRALEALGLPVAEHVRLESDGDLERALEFDYPGILKTASFGYDGKGQRRVEAPGDLERAWDQLGRGRTVLERLVPFVAELSVVGARAIDGGVALYDAVRNEHQRHILDVTTSPAQFGDECLAAASDLARAVLEGLDVVGVACVELFLLEDGGLVVNEIAPRPHNSGHLTIDANDVSQFEQQVRAICALPLGSSERLQPASAMVNLLGDLWRDGEPDWAAALADRGVHLHLYGKETPQPGRKMGHLTVLDTDPARARQRALAARGRLGSALRTSNPERV